MVPRAKKILYNIVSFNGQLILEYEAISTLEVRVLKV
jgi:hypothetical protein